ncbi:MAG TPA: aminotransferase class I/II-fold pyridoxal phosphate-dependent enzyme, partial [Planctomycetota bacterium]|nr:aminotransferase class I/II-fold pyridoxal phosphate-dependent enzyme [Planctomycetota bacterium]
MAPLPSGSTQPVSSARLGLFSGTPAFAEPLHVGRPNLPDRERLHERLDEILDRRWLTNNGPLVQAFERRLSLFFGVKHCIAMCNGTIGLEIMIRAAGLKGEVIVPSFTFVATAHSLQWQGIQPVFCDVDPDTHSLDPKRVEELITPNTTGILAVHTWGRVAEVEALQELADRHGLVLLFDAAHALGCSSKGRMVGSFGAAECFSMHATKVLNCFEGGAVTTDDDELAERIRFMRNFG